MNQKVINNFHLDDFIDKGEIFNLKIGDSFNKNYTKHITQFSNSLNYNGNSELINLKLDELKITIGFDDLDLIKYIMIKVPNYNENIKFYYKEFDLSEFNFDELLKYLNKENVKWSFEESLDKILKLKINKIEVIFSWEKGEEGIYCYQSKK